MKKVLIMTGDNCDDNELLYGIYRLQERDDVEFDVAALTVHEVKCKHFFSVPAVKTFEECNAEDYDAVYVPGGLAPEKIRQNEAAKKFIRDMDAAKKPIAAICHGPLVLISSGILKGRRATCYPGIADDIINAGAIHPEGRVVVDGNLVTARRPEDMPLIMREFVKMF